ncbi:LEPR-XLL domain-containing protein [Rhizobacter fulvus]
MQQPAPAPRSFRPSALFGHLQDAYRAMRGDEAAPPRQRRRPVVFEPVEPRMLLSSDLLPGLGAGVGYSPAPVQIFYIDADGAEHVDYRGPVRVEGIDVAAFTTSGALAGQESAVLAATLATLDDLDFGPNVRFTTDRPTDGAFSTIYLGGDGASFAPWGQFYGLSEAEDLGNLNPEDNAFVFSASMTWAELSLPDVAAQLATTIAHEAGHLLGTLAAHDADGDNLLAPLAFDPKVHVAIASDAADDAVDNGKVSIDIDGTSFEYTVHPLIVDALKNWRSYYNAGAVAGDGFPDALMGQFAIHPIDHATWLTRVLDMAWKAQGAGSPFDADEKSQILAWSYGFLTHSAADHWAHTLVNSFTEGVAPGFGAAAVSLPGDQRDLGNMVRHFLTEGYIADSLPGFDANKAERTLIDDKGTADPNDDDYSDDSTPAIAYDVPARFIYETFLRAFPDDPTSVVEMDWDKGTLTAASTGPTSGTFTRSDIGLLGLAGYNGFENEGFKVGHKITVTGFANAANNGTFLITAVTPTQLTVSGALANEVADGDEKIVVRPAKTAAFTAGQLVADAETGTFTRSDIGGSFLADGFVAGMRFDALGMNANGSTYVVKSVTAAAITVVGGLADATHRGELVDEVGAAGVQLVGIGSRGPLLDGIYKIRASVLDKAVEKGARSTDTNDLGTLAAQLIDKLVNGDPVSDTFKADVFRAYLYNWVDEIDEGVRHWGEFGLAVTKAMFDAGSRRELQEKVGAATGFVDTADSASIRSKAEDSVGLLDVIIAELDDPDGDGSTRDSFLTQHLLPMIGMPAELGLLRSALKDFASGLGAILAPVDATLNPATPAADDSKGFIKSFLKGQIEKRFGVDFTFFEQLRGLSNKMDLESITIAGKLVPIFKPGDHERLDALLGLPAGHHGTVIPQNVDSGPFQLKFFDDPEGGLNATAVMDKAAFDAYANAVTLSKMALLMESPAGDAVAGAGAAAGQLSKLYSDALGKLNGAATPYDFSTLNLNGAHGGNVLTATLPGAPGSAEGRPWLTSIDADQIWRADNYTVNNTLFRIGEFTDGANSPSLVEYTATGLAAGEYKVYASWQGNVTQDLDNLANSAFPDQKMSPTDKAQYSVSIAGGSAVTFQMNQSQFANDESDGDLAFEQLRTAAEATAKTDHVFTIAAGQALKVTLSNVTGGGDKHVIAGPIMLVRVSDGARFRIENKRDPVTLAPVATPGFTYNETVPAAWSDVVYGGGSGNDPLWESATLRPVFRALFDDWQNGALEFPDLGDGATAQAVTDAAARNELASHATAFAPTIPDHTLQVPISPELEAAILAGLQGVVDFAHSIETAPPLQVKIPGIDKSIADLVNLSGTVQSEVRQPIVDYFAANPNPTFEGLFAILPPLLGSFNANDGSSFEFDIDLRQAFAANLPLHLGDGAGGLGLELDGQLDVGALFAFVDSAASQLPRFGFGVDLTQDVASNFYIRAETLLLHAEAHSADLDFGAHLGFLSVGVNDGTIDFDADVTVDLSVLDANADQRITLAEIAAHIDSIDVATSGTLAGELPITIEALSGVTDLDAGTVTFGAADIFDTTTYTFDFSGLDTTALNFGNIDAAGVVSLIGRLADELDKLRNSGFFDQIDVPLVNGAIDGVLGFADVLTSGLLYDKGADGVKDGADRLSSDLNAALDTAGLGSVLIVQGTGNTPANTNKLLFQIVDPTVDSFKVELASGAAADFGAAGLGFAALAAAVFKTEHEATPTDGIIAGDVQLRVTLKRGTVEEQVFVTVTAAATANNLAVANVHKGIGDDTVKLLRADNSATFDTAQSLVARLGTILGAGTAVAYDPSTEALTIKLGALLPQLDFTKELPIDFNLDLGPLIGIQSDTKVKVSASVGFDDGFMLGVYLGKTVPGAQANLSDGSGATPATLLDALNDGAGVAIQTAPAVTAPNPVISAIRQLSGDATFEISMFNDAAGGTTHAFGNGTELVDLNGHFAFVSPGDTVFNITDGSSAIVVSVGQKEISPQPVQLFAPMITTTALTGGTNNVWAVGDTYRVAHVVKVAKGADAATPLVDLLAKINLAIDQLSALNGFDVVADGNRLKVVATSAPFGLEGFSVKAAATDPAVKDLGLPAYQLATGALVGDALETFKLVGGDAHFTLKVGNASYLVTVPLSATADNTDLNDILGNPTTLVGDVNAALLAALPAGLDGKIVADNDGASLVLRIADTSVGEVGFAAAIDDPAVLELGLSTQAVITKPAVQATKDLVSFVGRLAADATLTVTTTGGTGPSGTVTIYADDTATNNSILSLVHDVNQALSVPTLKTGVLSNFAPASAAFGVRINGGALVSVTVANLAGNTSLSDLVEDINAALKAANLDAFVSAKSSGTSSEAGKARVKFVADAGTVLRLEITALAGNGLQLPVGSSVATNFAGKLVAGSQGNKLLLTAADPALTAFTVAGNAAAAGLGLPVAVVSSNNVDVEIRVSNGTVYQVTLDGATDIAGVIAAIEAATAGKVQVEVNAAATGLTLRDTTFVPGGPNAARFMVSQVNGSGAATGLGIAGVDSTKDAELDGRIDGAQLVGVQLTDRFFMKDANLTATLDVTTVGPVSADANFGFVGIHLGGNAAFSAELSVGLKDPTTSGAGADGNISLREFINALPDFSSKLLATPALTGGGEVTLDVTVSGLDFLNLPAPGSPDAPTVTLDLLNLGDVFDTFADGPVALIGAVRAADGKSFTVSGDRTHDLTRGSRIQIGTGDSAYSTFATEVVYVAGVGTTVKVATHDGLLPASLVGLTAATPLAPAVDFQFDNFDKLLAFDNVNFDFASIVDALLLIRDLLSQIDGVSGVLNTPIPLVDVSINDLLNFVDTFSEALKQAQKNPAGSLQLLDQVISDAFGVAAHPAPGQPDLIDFEIDDHLLLGDTSDDLVKIKLDLGAAFSKSLNVRIPDLNLPSGLVDFGGAATLAAEGSGHFYLDLGIGLNDPSQVYLYDTSKLDAHLGLSGSDMAFKAGLGPLSLSIIDGEASIDGDLKVFFDFAKTGDSVVADAGGRVLLTGQLGAVLGTLDASFAAPVDVTLPIYFPTESHGIGDITLKGDLKNIANGLALKTDGTAPPADTIVLDVSNVLDGLTSGLANLSLLDQILFIVDGVDVVLGGVQDTLDGQVMGLSLPLIGDKLAGAADVVGDFRTGFLNNFRSEVEKLADPSENGIKDILFKLLGNSGLLIAVDQNGDAVKQGGKFVAGTANDIRSFNNLAEVNNIADAEIWWKVKIGQNLVDAGADIGLDIGIPGLGLETDGEIKLNIDWELDLGFGLSGKDGFFLFVDDPDELLLDVGVTLPGGSLKGTLGFLQFTALNEDVNGDGDQTHLNASFAINIENGDNPADTRLGLSELGRMSFDVLFAAEASVELAMTLGIAGDDGGFPQIQADFLLDWNLPQFSLLNPNDGFQFGSAIQDGLKLVEFRNVSLDVGSYLSNVVSPLVEKIQEITEPIQPIIDIVTTPLPVLSDLGLDITLLDIAKATGSVDPAFIDALETILDVISVLNSIDIPDDGSLLVPFGDFKVYESGNSLYDNFGDLGSGDFDVAGFANKLFGPNGSFNDYISGLPDGLQDVLGEVAGVAGEVLGGLADQEGGGTNPKPFRLDILEDPAQVFGLLLGKPAKLVSYDMPKLHFDAEFSAFFSIFGPLGVSINLEAALNIDFAFGYDSKGFADFAASDFKNPLLLANGLYIDDDPTPSDASDGTDPPELTFDGGLWAAAELNLGIARGGVGGGIFIGVDFNLFDNDHDGRVRLDELFTNFNNQLKAPNEAERFLAPLAVFDVSGKVTAELFAFLKIDFGFFELDKKFNITPPVTLADFDVDFFRPPVLASELDNGDLIINIGDFAGQRKLGDLTDFGEHIFVKSAGAGKVEVWSDNLGDDAKPHQTYSVTGRIIVVGGEGDDTIDLSGVDGSVKFDIDGGVGNDTLLGGAGGGIIRGGTGDDLITGGAGADLIFGNEGGDTIDAMGGNDIVLGDNGEVTEGLIDMAVRHGYVRALIGVSDGADTIRGNDGDDIVAGSGAADKLLDGGKGNDIVVGDGALFTYNSPAVVSDTEVGAGFADLLISGGEGDDWLYGGKGNDTIHGDAGNDVVFGGSGLDTIDGGLGDDTLFGDFGTFIGGDLAKPTVTVGGEADTIFGGMGADKILGGAGNDVIHGDDGSVSVGDGDIIWGGTGADSLYGDGGNDTIYGESDPDKLFGDDGNDFLEGGNGNDVVKGGLGNDLLVAGYGSDVLDGEQGSDTYRITARGGNITDLSTAYDSGPDKSDTDQLVLIGTPRADTVLLRGMADFYFPTLPKLVGKDAPAPKDVVEGLTDKIFNSEEPDKLRAVLQALEDSYGPHDIPAGLVHTLIGLYTAAVQTGVLAAIDANPGGAGTPSAAAVKTLVTGLLATDTGQFPGKLEEIAKAITAAYGVKPLPPLLLDAIGAAWDAVGDPLKAQLEAAITAAYKTELEVLGSDTDTGFVALINNGGANVERFNYRNLEGLTVNTLAGDDIVALDDVLVPTTVNLGLGADKVQVGQVFRSERVKDFAGQPAITGITAEDVFTSLEITRGWLSNGVSAATTINGGDGADQFTVFHNIAVLNLNGGDGDDVFTVRAFALRGSTDNERARTDMKGDGGADTILYVVNAPVGIDGGDGFDTVRIVGTEFGDDFVITDAGIFGAGLNVSYVNIEKIVADGAEGDDRFFVQSTGLEVVTEIDGGLGSDTFFVGVNPSGAPVAVVSNDFKGHSGVILHSVENAPDSDPDWSGVPIEGVSANVADNEESFVIVTESGGSSRVVEDSSVASAGWAYDYYGIRLTRAPTGTVRIKVVPAGMSPEDAAKNFKDLEFFFDGVVSPVEDYSNLGLLNTSLGFDSLTGAANVPTLTFDASNWDKVQYVKFAAAHDTASEGRRFTFINHSLKSSDSSDPNYQAAQTLSVKVLMEDDDRDGVIITPTGRDNTVLENGPSVAGFTDTFDVVLTKAPTANVTVTMNVLNGQVVLSGPSVTTVGGKPTLTFTTGNWNVRQQITITAPNDTVVEGFHTDYISYTVASADAEQTLPSGGGAAGTPPAFVAVDGDFDKLGVDPEIPATKPTTYLLLEHKPIVDSVAVKLNGVLLDAARFSVTGNTLSFFDANGQPEFVTGFVTVAYNYKEAGYQGAFVKDSVVDIYDEDTPSVIVQMPDDGSIDVIEGAAGNSDSYTVRLSQAPTAGQVVRIKVDAVDTRSTYGRTALFQEQVTVGGASQMFLTFTSANWNTPQTVTVRAIDDTVFDGNETQVFAPDLQTVNKIRGPLIIEGAAGAGSLSLPTPLMLPGELNILPPHGAVQGFVPGTGAGAFETMTVLKSDLLKALAELHADDSTVSLTDIQVLLDKTLELSSGPGTGVVLDPSRPDDRFDRFWQITELTEIGGGLVRLKLLNPSIVNPGTANVTAPTTDSQYAITSLSANFFAKESEQVDYLFVYDNDSVANENGALSSADGVVRGFDAANLKLLVEAAALDAVAKLDPGAPLVGRRIEISVGPGLGRSWEIESIGAGTDADTRWVKLKNPTTPAGAAVPTDRSEFRIAGGDTHGRITGFGMGPSILFNGRPQPSGVSYGDIEVVQVSLGRGDDTVRVDYTTNAEDHTTARTGDFYTLTLLDTGAGNDKVTVNLQNGDDGAFALNLNSGDDTADGSASSLPLVVFGWDGADKITGGSGDDILFGDRGRVDYVRTVSVDPDRDPTTDNNVLVDEIVTRLGHSVPLSPTNPPLTGSTVSTLTDANAAFSQLYGGLVGLSVQAISPQGHVQYRTITGNTANTLTVDRTWDAQPVGNYPLTTPVQKNNYFYRVSAFPEDQTDGLFRGPRVVWSIDETIGGDDTIYAGGGADLVIGGAGNDEVHAGAGADIVAGDDARIDFARVAGNDGPTQLLSIVTRLVTGDDKLYGDAGNDLLLGGLGADLADGGADNDILVGDAARIEFAPVAGLGNVIVRVETIDRASGGVDTLRGGDGDDVLAGGAAGDRLDGGAQDDLVFGDNVLLDFSKGSLNAIKPRFTTVAAGLYDLNGAPLVGGQVAPPYAAPAWADWTLTLDPTTLAANFGNDFIAGGANRDTIFGQRGNDTIQGDGSIDIAVAAVRDASGLHVTQASVELATDGDDYIEGNAGTDLIFGNLGQDDIVGGSSTMFSLNLRSQRDDEADLIFGGAGTDVARDHTGDGLHGRDSDMILGDNGNIRRVVAVGAGGATTYRSFTYDDAYAGIAGDSPIVVRSAELLDYTPGGIDQVPGAVDIGAADELHGESGDDFVYGMSGNDVLFGEGQDDDLIGGWGHDWISGGTGDDGVLGDDGRLLTTRNGTTEPLAGLTVATVQTFISTPGSVQSATINVTGQLKKTADMTPFGKGLDTLFDPALADDIIYGGWGNDFLHGGWGDDAISGAEALPGFYAAPANAGNVLAYNPATGEFLKYDEYAPMTRIVGFLLNFDANDGAPLDTYPAANTTTHRPTDGEDRIFGDYGNDWLVGGTGRDDLYGGWGDDLLNADDDQGLDGAPNTTPDTHYSYEDRAFGGAGRDVLIGNTGGDRLIDWVGEFNSYLVPFAPFGQATVSRTLQPQLAEFLYALSASDGADPTLGSAGDVRNGEPTGELGVVRQQDFAWQDQTGAPRDPQAGNVPGGKRDVLRSADLNDGALQGLAADSGTWQVSGGALQVASSSSISDAVAVYQVGDALPTYYEVLAKAKIIKPTGGWDANSYIVFDYQSKTNFKFAGIDAGTNKLVIGQRTAAGWQVLKQAVFTGSIKSENWYNLMLSVNGLTATLSVDNGTFISYVFQATVVDGFSYGLNWGLVGFGANKSRGALDNIAVQIVPPSSTVAYTNDFAAGAGAMFDTFSAGTWTAASGRLAALPPAGSDTAVDLIDLTNVTNLKTASLLELSTTLRTAGRAGYVFDWYGSTNFKFAAIDVATQQVLIGHRTAAGWFVDAVASRALNATTDYTLGVTVRGASVSVTLNGQATIGFVYNAVAADGRFGLFGKGAAGASFDAVTVKTNDPAVPAQQTAATTADVARTDASISAAQAQPLLAEAVRRWSLVEDASLTARLGRIEIDVADLPGASLAEYLDGRITIDIDAAGMGWFIDPTPRDDREFRGSGAVLAATASGGAAGRIDLLSVLAHELGHAMSFGHSAGGVMDEQRLPGQRALPDGWFGVAPSVPLPTWAAEAGATPAAPDLRLPDVTAAQIDWKVKPSAPAAQRSPATADAAGRATDRWQQRFVNHLGAPSDRLHVNAGLKVQLPVAPIVSRL